MKTNLLILSLLVCNVCFGQHVPLQHYLDSCKCNLSANSSIINGNGNIMYLNPYKHDKDTIKVIMAVGDTVSTYILFWRFGYLVREKHSTSENSNDPQSCLNCEWQDYYINLYYLDEKRNRLPKNYIVFDSKQIK
ncbi:MAG: hypothetical protein ACRDE8_08465 [Ginsengibacter sp.]